MLDYKNGELYCEEVAISDIAREAGTPFYIYSRRTLLENFNRIKKSYSSMAPLIAYSVKANSNLSILRILARDGSGFDIVTAGELYRVLKAGGSPDKIIFAGVGKTTSELEYAVKSNILMVNLESEAEAELLSRVALGLKSNIRVALRVNPDVEAHTHEYITTGKKENKFGISYKSAPAAIARISRLPNIEFVGLHVHVGSQILSQTPHVSGTKRVLELVDNLRSDGINIKYLNIGGGFGIGYGDHEKAMNIEKVAEKIIPLVKKADCRLIMEPGRFISGPAGALITEITYIKTGDIGQFAIVDAGMNDLIRPALYQAYHNILPVKEAKGEKKIAIDVVGPICESADCFAKDRKLPPLKAGDLLALCDAGAYGYVMASNYNTRPLPPEILVNGNLFDIVNRRETFEDILSGEKYPDYLK
jgi:diaminopimelate decarboxylase